MRLPPARATVDPPELLRREDLITVVNQAGSAFKVIGSLTNEGPSGPIWTAADMLTAAKLNAQTPGTTIKERLGALEAALGAANLIAPPIPLPTIPVRVVMPAPLAPTTTPAHPTPAPHSAAAPTASGAPVRAAH